MLIFLQLVVTPQAGGPHHYSMIFPLPLLTFVFLAQPMYTQIATKNLRRFAALLLILVAALVFGVNLHNTMECLSRFRNNSSYNPRLSPEIYSLSRYINMNGLEVQNVISIDWGLHNQPHALAPRRLRPQMRDSWPIFKTVETQSQQQQSAVLRHLFLKEKASRSHFLHRRKHFQRQGEIS